MHHEFQTRKKTQKSNIEKQLITLVNNNKKLKIIKNKEQPNYGKSYLIKSPIILIKLKMLIIICTKVN